MEKSQSIENLAKALVEFQKEMKPVIFDANNPFFKSKYATLATLVETASPIATKYGLAVSQLPEDEGGITTILMHTSGEYIAAKLTLKPVKDDPQGKGSAITYSRRYAYASILGLVADDDDDGNAATALKKDAKPIYAQSIVKSTPKFTLMGEIKRLAIENVGDDTDKFQVWRVDNNLPEKLEGLTDLQLSKVLSALRTYKKV